jgi:hypothetical protein
MDKELKIFFIKGSFIFGALALLGGSALGINTYREARIEQKKAEAHKLAQLLITDMLEQCSLGNMDQSEQDRLQKCGDDIEQVRFFLNATLQDRINYWNGRMQDSDNRFNKVVRIKKNDSYWSYEDERAFQEAISSLVADYLKEKSQHDGFVLIKQAFSKWNQPEALKRQQDKNAPKKNSDSKA